MQMVLQPRAALRLRAFTYPVNRYYQSVQDDETPPLPQPEACCVAIFRHEELIWRMELEAEEYTLLERLFAGAPIGKALEGMDESAAESLSVWFSRWIRNGLLANTKQSNRHSERSEESAFYEGERSFA